MQRNEERLKSSKSIWPSSPPYKPYPSKADKKRKLSNSQEEDLPEPKMFELANEQSDEEIIGPLPTTVNLENDKVEVDMKSSVYGYSKSEVDAFRRAGYVMSGSRQIDGVEIVKITTDVAAGSNQKSTYPKKKPTLASNQKLNENKILTEFKEMLQNKNRK